MKASRNHLERIFMLLLCLPLLNSCSLIASLVINSGFKDAKVETTQSTMQFQLENNFDTTNSFIIHADTGNAYYWIQQSIGGEFQLFDSTGNLIEYNGSASCSGIIFSEFIQGKNDSFKVHPSTYNLTNILNKCYDYRENYVDFSKIKNADFYAIACWSKFAGGKSGYEDGVRLYEEELKKHPHKRIILLKLNTDLQEKWGMKKNGKAKIKIKVVKREAILNIGPLPWKN